MFYKNKKKLHIFKRALRFSLWKWKRNEANMSEEYWQAITQATGWPCCDLSGSSVLDHGFQPDWLPPFYVHRPTRLTVCIFQYDLRRTFLDVAVACVRECLYLLVEAGNQLLVASPTAQSLNQLSYRSSEFIWFFSFHINAFDWNIQNAT
jgi:hypothetical protein